MVNENQSGDPKGRRLWRDKAVKLYEGHAVARLLNILLSDTDVEPDLCLRLLGEIERQERIALQRAYGRVEPRKRYKGQKSHPLQENRSVNGLYIDEAGKSNREPLDGPTFFSLGAVAIDDAERRKYCEKADAVKRRFFQSTEITFHEPQMRRRDGLYYFAGDAAKQRAFDDAIGELIDSTDFTVFGVGIRKNAFQNEFAATGADPYLPTDVYSVAIILLMERYVDYIATTRSDLIGRVTFESQGPKEDALHQYGYARILLDGSQWVSGSAFRNWLEAGLHFVPKRGSEPTELADLVARDIYEWVRSDCTVAPIWWDQLSRKTYCRGDGRMGKFGIKIFPDHDIRDRIEAHRLQYGATAN